MRRPILVMPGLDPGIHRTKQTAGRKPGLLLVDHTTLERIGLQPFSDGTRITPSDHPTEQN
jgi:hypothetical protein